ncbi:MAG: hypothetical protein HY741_12910 [Chloroflexi bacterium]|nr:hypothetical protein [Chloroflexota bacterium]
MLQRKLLFTLSIAFLCAWMLVWLLGMSPHARADSNTMPLALDPSPPATTQRLVFIHHSTGQNLLNDALRTQLNNNNYYVTETDYGWGPPDEDLGYDTIGDHTDIGHWYNWFAGSHRDTYMNALYPNDMTEGNNTVTDPGGENNIILFKSCFPNSHIGGNPNDPPTTGANPLRGQDAYSEYLTVGNIKGIYNDLLPYLAARQDKLFVVITAPPLRRASTDAAHAANARAVNTWLVNDWLAAYPYQNVVVFDFYNVLTSNGGDYDTNDYDWETGNHHRYRNGAIQYVTDQGTNYSKYPTGGADDHPSPAGNDKAAREFVILLNIWYHRWQADSGTPTATESPSPTPTITLTPTATESPSPTPTPTATTVCSGAPASPALAAPPNNSTTAKTRPVLKWNAASCATRYIVIVKDAATGNKADKQSTSALQYKTKALARGRTYKWFVKACSSGNVCTKSATWRVTIR